MTENTNDAPVELSDQDREDLRSLGIDPEGEESTQRSLFEIWKELFSNVENVRAQRIPFNVASKVVSAWPKLSYQDTAVYHDVYHSYLSALGDFLDEVKPEAFAFHGEDDGVENREDYIELLVKWHVYLDFLQSSWNAGDADSHILGAALVDAGGFVFNQTGLLGHLGAIGFQLDEADFMARVAAAKEA